MLSECELSCLVFLVLLQSLLHNLNRLQWHGGPSTSYQQEITTTAFCPGPPAQPVPVPGPDLSNSLLFSALVTDLPWLRVSSSSSGSQLKMSSSGTHVLHSSAFTAPTHLIQLKKGLTITCRAALNTEIQQ